MVILQIYEVLVNLSPAVEVSLWKGMKLMVQMVIPFCNDGYASRLGILHPFFSVSQLARFPCNTLGIFAVVNFSNRRFGADLKVVHHFRNERFSISGRLGYTTAGYWNGFVNRFTPTMRLTWSLGGSFTGRALI